MERWRALRHRNFRLFFLGQFVSLTGTWMQEVAQSWLVLELTGDPLMLGVVASAQYLPVLLFGLFGGLVADGWPKRRTLIVSNSVAMCLALALGLLAATGRVEVWQIVLLALALGCTKAVEIPTRQSFFSEMVGPEDVTNAVALNSAGLNLARVIGPPIAGVTIGLLGVSLAFFVNAASYTGVIAALLLMRDSELIRGQPLRSLRSMRSIGSSLAEGLRYVRDVEPILVAMVVLGVISIFALNFTVVIPPLVQDSFDAGPEVYGLLMSAYGLGSLGAAILVTMVRRPDQRVIALGTIGLGVSEMVVGGTDTALVATGAMFMVGVGAIIATTTANMVIQVATPDRLRGRVMSVYTLVFGGTPPIGAIFMGAAAAAWGAGVSIVLGGLICVGAGVAMVIWLSRWAGRARPVNFHTTS